MTTPPVARYVQVADHLRNQILAGELAPGEELPSQPTLAAEYQLNQSTINKSIKLLAAEGLIEVSHGRRARVAESRPVTHVSTSYVIPDDLGQRTQWTRALAQQGMTGRQTLRRVEIVSPPDDVSAWLDTDQAVLRDRVLSLDGAPVQLARSWYPTTIAEGTELAQHSPMRGGTVAALERLGFALDRFYEQVEARLPHRDEATDLNLAASEPVIRHVRITYADTGTPVEVGETIMTANRHVLSYDLPARL